MLCGQTTAAFHTIPLAMGAPHHHHIPPADPGRPRIRLHLRVGTLGILAFWLVVMAVLYFAMQYTP